MANENNVRLSGPTLKVLKYFVDAPREQRSGAEITRGTKVGAGTLYPMLARLEAAGWLTSEWELLDPSEAGRPRRRYYRLTPVGQASTHRALSEFQMVEVGGLAWNS